MRVMSEVTNPVARGHTMTKGQGKGGIIAIKGPLERDADFLRMAVRSAIEAGLEAEMTEALCAEKRERTEARLGYRNGYYQRSLITLVGMLELQVPQDRAGRFSTELLERYQRWEKALVGALAEMYVQGRRVSQRQATANTLRGLLKAFGHVVRKGAGGLFARRVREVCDDNPALRVITEPMLVVCQSLRTDPYPGQPASQARQV
jgi:hypothetical protein